VVSQIAALAGAGTAKRSAQHLPLEQVDGGCGSIAARLVFQCAASMTARPHVLYGRSVASKILPGLAMPAWTWRWWPGLVPIRPRRCPAARNSPSPVWYRPRAQPRFHGPHRRAGARVAGAARRPCAPRSASTQWPAHVEEVQEVLLQALPRNPCGDWLSGQLARPVAAAGAVAPEMATTSRERP